MSDAGATTGDGFSVAGVVVRDCEPCQLAAFRELNLAWIRRYFTIEAKDRALLDDPQRGILDQGGIILVAIWPGGPQQGTDVVGTCALLREGDGTVWQLAKMAVAERFLGRRIGLLLGEAAIARARLEGAGRLRLETNSSLTAALRLYEKLGFVHVPAQESAYTRADVQMVIEW